MRGARELASGPYTLRYTGGLVTDVMQLLIKRHGIFASAPAEDRPSLLLLHEAIPMAFLVEKARRVLGWHRHFAARPSRRRAGRARRSPSAPGRCAEFDEVVGAWVGAATRRASTSS